MRSFWEEEEGPQWVQRLRTERGNEDQVRVSTSPEPRSKRAWGREESPVTGDNEKNEPQARPQGTGLRDGGSEGNRKGLIWWEA